MSARTIIITFLAIASACTAQDLPNAPSSQASQVEKAPRVPGVASALHGLNVGITFAGVHDSGIGWYTTLTPAVSYAFAKDFSADITLTLYPSRNAVTTDTTGITSQLTPTHWDAGDTWLSAHYTVIPHRFINTATAALSFPTGNEDHGLSTGRVSFDLSDHIERYHHSLGALLDIGGGDSSALFNNLVNKDVSSLGAIAHFQTGLIYWFPSTWFPGRAYIQSLAYEQLPLGDQKIYTTIKIQSPGSPIGVTQTTRIVTGRHVYEDNGFTTAVGIPLTPHVTFSSYYNRSLRQHLDTVATGLTFVWKGTPTHHRESIYDKAFLEGERILEEEKAQSPGTKK